MRSVDRVVHDERLALGQGTAYREAFSSSSIPRACRDRSSTQVFAGSGVKEAAGFRFDGVGECGCSTLPT